MEDHEIKPIIEALLFISLDPISIDRIKEILSGVEKKRILDQLVSLQEEYARFNRGMQIVEVAGGYQMTTRADMAPWIQALEKIKTASRLSQPSLETLAIIAYKQPLTRAEIEAIRGVDAAGVLKTLMDRRLVKIVGRKEAAGRPLIYGTTREFLLYFGLSNLTALPTLKEFTDISERVAEPERDAEEEMEMVGAQSSPYRNGHQKEDV
jgi:segregation and condensation protein B